MEYVLQTNSLTKKYKEFKALNGLSMNVPKGAIYGFVGKNGAGKTTTMKIILGLPQHDGGAVYVAGTRVTYGQSASNHFVGYLPDVPEFYPFMTAPEYLTFCGETHRIKGFSRGMKQRLGIAQALLTAPDC